jgi:hypothetical protein
MRVLRCPQEEHRGRVRLNEDGAALGITMVGNCTINLLGKTDIFDMPHSASRKKTGG